MDHKNIQDKFFKQFSIKGWQNKTNQSQLWDKTLSLDSILNCMDKWLVVNTIIHKFFQKKNKV